LFLEEASQVPLYEYKCLKCGQRTEKIEKHDGPRLKKCPKCGGKVEPMISSPSFQFKGSGWYVTDYARKSTSTGSDESGKKDSSASESAVKSESSESRDSRESSKASKDSKETKSKDTRDSSSSKDSKKSTSSKK
jgi:putative FmdB family regulatory protein